MFNSKERFKDKSRIRILIVEDSLLLMFALKTTLENFGFPRIITCDSGEIAIQLATHEKIDLILMDVNLSGKMTGIEALEEILNVKRIPCIVLSSSIEPEHRNKAAEMGCPFLSKPFSDNQLLTLIHDELGLKR